MKLRTLALSVAFLAVLSVVAYLANRPAPAPAADPRVGKPLLDQDTAARAAGLVVSDQGKKVELARGADGVWRVTGYFDLPADFDKIARFVQDLNEAKVDRFVTDNPERLSHLEFKDSTVVLEGPSGKEIWSLTLGKTADTGNGRFIRFGGETKAYFSSLHAWLDTDPKGWADARLVTVKPEEVAKIEMPFDGTPGVTAVRAKKDAPWTSEATPSGQKLVADKVLAAIISLTSLRFTDTVEPKDASVAEAQGHLRTFRLTTFDGKTLTIALGRKPEEKRPKPAEPAADKTATAPAAKPTEANAGAKPAAPEMETIPAGPVFAFVSSSDPHAAVNQMMKRRAFEVDEYSFTGLPQKADELFEAAKAK